MSRARARKRRGCTRGSGISWSNLASPVFTRQGASCRSAKSVVSAFRSQVFGVSAALASLVALVAPHPVPVPVGRQRRPIALGVDYGARKGRVVAHRRNPIVGGGITSLDSARGLERCRPLASTLKADMRRSQEEVPMQASLPTGSRYHLAD